MDKKEIAKLIETKKSLHLNDPNVTIIWKRLCEIFSSDEQETISYLKQAPVDEIEVISEVFDDISAHLQNRNFLGKLRNGGLPYTVNKVRLIADLTEEMVI